MDNESDFHMKLLRQNYDDIGKKRFRDLHDENAKLKRLLSEACGLIEKEWVWISPEEWGQWYEEHKQQEESK